MSETVHPITILGAGPGGAATALFLARKGIPSILLDKATFPRDKICGDALSGKVVEVLKKLDPGLIDRMDLDPTHLGSWGVTFVAPNLKALRVPFRKELDKTQTAPGFIAKRLDFDNFLVEECRRYPEIDLREGVDIRGFQRHAEGFTLLGRDNKPYLHTKLLIAADGAQSRFAREYGGIKMEHNHYCAGIRAYYKGVKDLDKDNFIELQFLKEFLPGYFWIFPLPNGWANVGVGMRSDKLTAKKVNLKDSLHELVRTHPALRDRFEGAEQIGPIKGFGLPLGSKKRPLSGDHYLLIGDAASLIDPFTGEGIGNALYSGYFAAEQAALSLQSGDYSAAALAPYNKAVYDRLWSELKLGRRMQQLVKYPWLFNFVVNKARKNKVLSETISCMFEDIELRARLKKPGFYFQLLFNYGYK